MNTIGSFLTTLKGLAMGWIQRTTADYFPKLNRKQKVEY
jgi:hypothetical protein